MLNHKMETIIYFINAVIEFRKKQSHICTPLENDIKTSYEYYKTVHQR